MAKYKIGASIWGGLGQMGGSTPTKKAANTPGSVAYNVKHGYRPDGIAPSNPLIEGVFNDTLTDAGTSKTNSIIGINEDAAATANDYGFGFTRDNFNPNQPLSVDPANPFSKMALLQRSYEQAKSGTTNSYGAQGQYNSGAYGRAQDSNAFNNTQQDDSLRRAFQQVLRDAQKGVASAGDNYNTTVGTAAYNRLNAYLGSK